MTLNIAGTLTEIAMKHGNRTGLIEAASGKKMTFAELEEAAGRFSSFLANEGVVAGQKVMLMVRPSADFICLTFALFRLGTPVILIDPGMGYKNLLRCIATVRPDYLIGIPLVVLLSHLFRKPFKTVRRRFCCGPGYGLLGRDIRKQKDRPLPPTPLFQPDNDSLAAIIFTTGSTGPPKGVRYEHTIFATQLNFIRDYYQIGPGDIDQPGFPLFALFSIALGACAVIPDMDPTRPAKVNPAVFVNSLEKYGVTYSFGSPAIWNVVSGYCLQQKKRCNTLKKVLMAGAPVSGELIARVFDVINQDGSIFTPYGATESLPIVSIEGREILASTWQETQLGSGVCVGRPLPGIKIRVVECSDEPFSSTDECRDMAQGQIGEIIVKGDVVTRAYENNDKENHVSKIPDSDGFWHRMGDVGYLDESSRLWFCGRKAHRVHARGGMLYTIQCEAIINTHNDVFRSALVGIDGEDGYEIPVLIIELKKTCKRKSGDVLEEVKSKAAGNQLTAEILHFLVHPSFPVDIRHNAKIFREQLKLWAQTKIENRL